MKKMTKKYIIRLISALIVLAWMIIVFKYSNEPADISSKTSSVITRKIVEILGNKNNEDLIKKMDPIVRKLAHFTLYMYGGIVILNFVNTYNLRDKRKIAYSIICGAFYACTDEFHQYFIEGRSAEITDVFIDSLGVATGVCIFLCVIKVISKLMKK